MQTTGHQVKPMTSNSTYPDLISGLMKPAAFPHPCDRIQLLETHISWVLLTGGKAYKIKKPVRLGFADFGSLEKRRFFCEEELRLNQRLAPDLYLGVVPVTADGPRIGGSGPVIDYAVCMRQFDQDCLLSNVLPNQLRSSHIDQLADSCADFHEGVAVADPDSRFGSPAAIMEAVRDNFTTLRNGDRSIRPLVDQLAQTAEARFAKLHPVFAQRKADGMIRECHGDLHLGNMFLQNDRVTVFDGIEFNEDLRWIDIVNDIAFTVMDLEDRGYVSHSRRFLNRWLEQTGDYGGLPVLSFYCSYRAAVRAKVDTIRMHQPDLSFSDLRHLSSDCAGYLKLAQKFTVQPQQALMITTGLSGSGKTTVTQELIEATETIRIRSDVERKRLFDLKPEQASSSEQRSAVYSPEASAATYRRLANLAAQIIDSGFPVVVDATFLRPTERQHFASLAADLGVPFVIIECRATADELRKRIRQRAASQRDASEADEQVLEAQLRSVEPLSESESARAIDGSATDMVAQLQSMLQQQA